MPLNKQQGLEVFLQGLKGGQQKAALAQEGSNEQALEDQKQKNLMALQQFLKGSVSADGTYHPGVESAAEGATTDQNIQRAQQIKDGITDGGGVSLGANGSVNLSKGYNLTGVQQKNKSGEDAAYKNAANKYQSEVQKGGEALNALKNGLSALQSNDASSAGQLNASYLLANGFHRYNPEEASALNPAGAQTSVAGLLAKAGLDPQGHALSDTARANFVRFANGKLDELQDNHNTLKAQVQNMYSGSSYADPQKAATLGQTLGGPVDSQITSLKNQFDKFHSQAIPASAAQGDNQPSGGLKGLLSSIWNGSPKPQAQPSQAPPQANQSSQQPSSDFDDITAALQRKAQKALQQQSQQKQQPGQPQQGQ